MSCPHVSRADGGLCQATTIDLSLQPSQAQQVSKEFMDEKTDRLQEPGARLSMHSQHPSSTLPCGSPPGQGAAQREGEMLQTEQNCFCSSRKGQVLAMAKEQQSSSSLGHMGRMRLCPPQSRQQMSPRAYSVPSSATKAPHWPKTLSSKDSEWLFVLNKDDFKPIFQLCLQHPRCALLFQSKECFIILGVFLLL